MDYVYIAMVDTPGLLADMIRKATGNNYIHVVISMDEGFEHAYSFGRRNPQIPIIAGFEQEETDRILHKFPTARYRITRIPCEPHKKEAMMAQLQEMYRERYTYHYCVAGLFAVLFQKPLHQRNFYTCSSFAARLLEQQGMQLFDKDYSLVTPDDFYHLEQLECIYEGYFRDYAKEHCTRGHYARNHHLIGVAYES